MKCVSDDDLHPVPNTSLLKILRWSFGADGWVFFVLNNARPGMGDFLLSVHRRRQWFEIFEEQIFHCK
jgi:hypothetical protein